MNILFLDDHPEMLDTYRLIEKPALFQPHSSAEPGNLFDQPLAKEDKGFIPIQEVEFKGAYYAEAKQAEAAFRNAFGTIRQFQIAVLDMQLTESSGLEVASTMLAIDPSLNILFITAYTNWSIHDISRHLGVTSTQFMFIKKPFEFQEVVQALLYMRHNIQQNSWQMEAVRNLLNFTRRYKAESMQLFDALLELRSFELVRSLSSQRIPEMIMKNERVLELVEAILLKDNGVPEESFLLEDLLGDMKSDPRVSIISEPTTLVLSKIQGYRRLIGIALKSLITNALEYSSGPVNVTIRETGEERMEFLVEDRGSGISKEYLHQVFEPGVTLHKSEKKSGFGLAMVKKIVMGLHHSDLAVRSVPGQGTAVRFTLPTVA